VIERRARSLIGGRRIVSGRTEKGDILLFQNHGRDEGLFYNLSGVTIAPNRPPALFVRKRKPRGFLGK
jgi:hypothetical protein